MTKPSRRPTLRALCASLALLCASLAATAAADEEGQATVPDYLSTDAHPAPAETDFDALKNRAVPVFMGLVGLGIAGIWTADIAQGRFSDQGNFFAWREGENLLWPHLLAEYLTAAGLIAGGAGLYLDTDWGLSVSLLSLGALTYTAINSSGWVLAERDRISYGIPMWVGLAGGVVSIAVLLN